MYAEKPWLEFYEPHVPEHLEYPATLLPVAFAQTAAEYPDHPLIIFTDRVLTFAQVNDAVNRFAAALQSLGVGKGTLVAIHLPNCPQFPIAFFATLRLGGTTTLCPSCRTGFPSKFPKRIKE